MCCLHVNLGQNGAIWARCPDSTQGRILHIVVGCLLECRLFDSLLRGRGHGWRKDNEHCRVEKIQPGNHIEVRSNNENIGGRRWTMEFVVNHFMQKYYDFWKTVSIVKEFFVKAFSPIPRPQSSTTTLPRWPHLLACCQLIPWCTSYIEYNMSRPGGMRWS